MPHNALQYDQSSGGGSTLVSAQSQNTQIRGTRVRVTRPNNATAYVANQVYGDAADARLQFVVPAAPAAQYSTPYTQLAFRAIHGAPFNQPSLTLQLWLFSAQPATVLGDGAALALSDADIQNLWVPIVTNAGTAAITFAAGTQGAAPTLNTSASVAGRAIVNATLFGQGIPGQLGLLVPGTSLWGYLQVTAAYNPLALETVDLIPYFTTPFVTP